MRVSGRRTSSMDMERKHGLMKLCTRVSTVTERSTGRVSSSGRTIVVTRVIFKIITSTESENMCGLMVEFTRVNGRITKWREKEFSLG